MSIVSEQLDYQKNQYMHPSYKYQRIYQQSGGTSVTLSSAGGQESIFECQADKPYNLSRSYVTFDYAVAGASGAANWNYISMIPYFRQVQFGNRGGLFLVDLMNPNIWTKISLLPDQRFEEYRSETYELPGGATGTYLNTTFCAPMTGSTANNNPRHNNTTANVLGEEVQYFFIGGIQAGFNDGNTTIFAIVPLKKFRKTIFALDKDIMFKEVMNIRLVWNQISQISFRAASVTNAGTTTTSVTSATISNLVFWLAIETNDMIANDIRAKINSGEGLQMLIDYVWSPNRVQLSGTAQNTTTRFNGSHGLTLTEVWYSLFNSTDTNDTAYDNNNIADAKVKEYYTMMDNVRLQDYNVDTYNSLNGANYDYITNKQYFKGSILLNNNMYKYNWFHIDKFDDVLSPVDLPLSVSASNYLSGLSLDHERKYDFVGTDITSGTYNHYCFGVTKRLLKISPSGIELR